MVQYDVTWSSVTSSVSVLCDWGSLISNSIVAPRVLEYTNHAVITGARTDGRQTGPSITEVIVQT